jgi:outer membrane receptor protein involved in Fe transport
MQIHCRHYAAPRRHPLTLALWAAALCLPATLTMAQDAASSQAPANDKTKQLDTIVVTAQKREQQIQEVPIAISAYSGDFLEKNGMDNYQSLGTLVPGLEIQMQSVANPSLSIRGITADLDDPTQEPRISVFQDGVSMSRSRGSFATPFDMQRVEVLRGPQGTLFGRAAEIGALHFIQNKARPGTSSAFGVEVGNFSERKFDGFYNGSLSDNVFGRIAVYYDKRDGYVDNLSGGTLQGVDTQAIRGSLHFNIGDSNGLDLILNHEKDTPPGTAFRSMVVPNRRASSADIATFNAWLGSSSTSGLPAVSTGLDPYEADAQRGNGLGSDRTLDSATVLGHFRINDSWSLHTTTGWRHFHSIEKFDADGSQADLVEFDEHATGRQLSQEFRFNYDNGGRFTGFVGLDYTAEKSLRDLTYQTDERQLYALLSPTAHSIFPFLPVVPLLNPDGTPNTSTGSLLGLFVLNPNHHETFGNDVDVHSTELFADGTWQLNDHWEFTAGLRGTHDSATYGYHSDPGTASTIGKFFSGRTDPNTGAFIPACPSIFGSCFNLLFPATNGRLTASKSWDSAVGRAILRYKFNDDVNAYASVSRGRRPAMLQVSDINPTSPTGVKDLPAEIVMSYEVGLKGTTVDSRLAYDLALWYYDYTNFQAQLRSPSSSIPQPTNGGSAHAYGLEASLFVRLSEHTTGFVNLGLSDGGFNGVDGNGRPQLLAGNTFRLFPKQKLAVGLDWTHPLSGDREFFLRPNVTYQSKVFFEDDNHPSSLGHSFAGQIQQSGYGLVNLRGGVNFGKEWTVTVSLDNALNKKYLIDAGNTGLTFGIPTLIPGQTRTLGVSLNGRF